MWVAGADALRFEHGTVLSQNVFPVPATGERTIEIWSQPGKIRDSNTLLAFYDPARSRAVSFRQEWSDLVIEIGSSTAWRGMRGGQLFVPDAFLDGKRAFWAVAFSGSGTAVYRDGVLAVRSALHPSIAELGGELIVSGSPIFDNSWTGDLSGLAIYDAALTEAQVARHYASWTAVPKPAIASGDRCMGSTSSTSIRAISFTTRFVRKIICTSRRNTWFSVRRYSILYGGHLAGIADFGRMR